MSRVFLPQCVSVRESVSLCVWALIWSCEVTSFLFGPCALQVCETDLVELKARICSHSDSKTHAASQSPCEMYMLGSY